MSFQNPRILCVDDNEDCRELLEVMLQLANEDYEIMSASTAEEALNLIKDKLFDLYILDYLLPDATGTILCRRIHQIDSPAPILFYSGMARDISREMALRAGACDYLIKPNDLERLPETVARILNETLQANPCGYGSNSFTGTT